MGKTIFLGHIVPLEPRLSPKNGLHSTFQQKLWYVDFTHKYKIIQGVILGWSPSNYNFLGAKAPRGLAHVKKKGDGKVSD